MMFADEVRELFLSYPHCTEGTPFGPEVLVYKVANKMFALLSPEDMPPSMNLKCDPEKALELRDRYEAVLPGFHMNKKHWNTVRIDQSVPSAVLREMIDDSFRLVVAGMPKKERDKFMV